MALAEECSKLRSTWAARAAQVRDDAKAAVTEAIWQYGRQGEWYQNLEGCTEQATAIALGLADAEVFGLAAERLGWIARQVDTYDKDSQNPHLVLKALVLQGVAQVRTNDWDGGIAKIAYAAERSAGTSLEPWVYEYLYDEFERWGFELLAGAARYPRWIKGPEQHATKALELLGVRRYAVMATIRTIFRLAELHTEAPSDYTRMRLLDAYRGLTASIESLSKEIGRGSQDAQTRLFFESKRRLMLYEALEQLLSSSDFWSLAGDRNITNFDTRKPFTSFSEKMRRVAGEPRNSLHLLLAQAVAAACLVRNFAAHEVTFDNVLDDQQVHRATGELTIAAFVYLPYMCQQAGHLEKFWHD